MPVNATGATRQTVFGYQQEVLGRRAMTDNDPGRRIRAVERVHANHRAENRPRPRRGGDGVRGELRARTTGTTRRSHDQAIILIEPRQRTRRLARLANRTSRQRSRTGKVLISQSVASQSGGVG